MQYFIPAWYQKDDWKEEEQVWYRSRSVTEFDDTVKQVQLFFRKNVAPFKMLILGFTPNFRHFLHRQGVYHAPYWSCFDAMQGIETQDMQVFSFRDLDWPDGVEFIYSPFAVIVNRNGKKYAQVEFAEDGNMFRVDMFDGEKTCSNIYDDRGFISCQVVYKKGLPFREQYFDEAGDWRFARFLEDGHVVINPEHAWFYGNNEEKIPYRKERYGSLEEVIEEVLRKHLEDVWQEDIFIAAMDPLHSGILLRAFSDHKLVLSFFSRRMEEHGIGETDGQLLQYADYIVADKKETADRIRKHPEAEGVKLKVITPYDSRVEFGISQQLRVQNILVAVDGIEDQLFDEMAAALGAYIQNTNSRARVCLFTRSAGYSARRILMEKSRRALEKAGLDPELAGDDRGVSENAIDSVGQVRAVFSVAQCVDEMSVSRTLREQRLVVDLQQIPDQFLQIAAMSMGIPQITAMETDYMKDGRNGLVVRDIGDLPGALDNYLSSIANYNEAQIASYDLGDQFTTDKLVKAWKEVLQSVEDKSTAAGQN